MKGLIFASASALLVSLAGAFAADLPTRKAAPVPVEAAVFSWTGCYAGLHAGAVSNSAQFSGLNTAVTNRAQVGVQAGCNYQFEHLVIGAEGQLNEGFWSGQRAGFREDIALRGGYAFDRALVFGKVGAGFVNNGFGVRFPALNLVERTTQERVGLLLGGGVEYAIDRHWSVKGEVDYINYGNRDVAFTGPQPLNINVRTSQIGGDIGVNYRF